MINDKKKNLKTAFLKHDFSKSGTIDFIDDF